MCNSNKMINFAVKKLLIVMRKLFVITIIIALQSCYFLPIWEEDLCLVVDNNSNDSLLIYVASGILPTNPTTYPDTLLPKDAYVGDVNLPHSNDSISGYLIHAPSHERTAILCTIVNTDYWGHGLYDKFCNDFIRPKILSVFFISADSVKNYGYDYVANNNMIEARYDLTSSDLKSLDMFIPYPPTESMSGMKRWTKD